MKYRVWPLVVIVAIAAAAFAGCQNPAGSDLDEDLDGIGGGGTPIPPSPPVNSPADLAAIPFRSLVAVDGGVFLQEDVNDNAFEHTIGNYDIGVYQVTYELWYAVRGWALANGYTFANAGREGHAGGDGAAPTASAKHHPVTTVSWFDVVVWANAYSEMDGLTPVYYMDVAHMEVLRDATIGGNVPLDNVDWNADGYRLPTEGEWEYAARWRGDDDADAGVVEYPDRSGRFWTPPKWASGATDSVADADETGKVAWYSANSGDRTRAVGTLAANQLGIHDMSGNVWEWIWDWRTQYPDTPQSDFRGSNAGTYRAGRGGAWNTGSAEVRVGLRSGLEPDGALIQTGFRLARTGG